MAIKENIEFLKEELSGEEKFLEQIIRVEKFYKRYKKEIITFAILLIIVAVGYVGYNLKKEHDLNVSNRAYLNLLKNPSHKESLNILKEKNIDLYNLYLFRMALKSNDIEKLNEIASKNIPFISNIALYQVASLKKDKDLLYKYELNQKSLLKDLAILQEAFLLYEKREFEKAKKRLELIDKNSNAAPYAQFLLHYGIKVK